MNPVLSGSQLSCAVCGTELRTSARFCDGCGALVGASRSEERKQVTVLFADVVGSMRMAASLDPERLREIMHELFNRSVSVVQRYHGTVDKFTGDGLMALFGAPAALEDHALCACLSALELQALARDLAVAVRERDGMDLRLRVGLNSGEVIVGDFGSPTAGYTVTGHTVGMAQRMESAARPGEVLCSASTARLVEHAARLAAWDTIAVKGFDEPVAVRRLEAIDSDRPVMARDDGPLVGRADDLAELVESFDNGGMSVVSVIGEPGLGKSRLLREFATHATARDAQLVVTHCEAHMAHVPLRVLSRLMRGVFGVRQLDDAAAREHVMRQLGDLAQPDSDAVAVLFDAMGLGEAEASTGKTSTDARRHMLIEMIGSAIKARRRRSVFLVEDLHWVDPASDEFLAELAAMLDATDSLLVASFRPEYEGRLRETSNTTIRLSPLSASATVALAAQLIGDQPTARGAAKLIAEPSAGNPFFVEEIVRDLAGRSVLTGSRGDYRFDQGLDSIAVPATVQAVLAARIDRLTSMEKSILNAAAVIGTSFGLDDLGVLLPDVEVSRLRGLVAAELIDQIELLPQVRYAFRHPLVRTVCYESQLSATRCTSHGLLAAAIAQRNSAAANENSALIAHHLEAAGQLDAAHTWYMRAGGWLKHWDFVAARECWHRAQRIADGLPEGEGRDAKRIAPRAQLTSTAWLVGADSAQCFDELRELTTQFDDWLPLAEGMSGRLTSLIITDGRVFEGVAMAAELQALIDQIDSPPALRAEILMAIEFAQFEGCDFDSTLRTAERLLAISEARQDDAIPGASIAAVIKVMTGRRAEGLRDLQAAVDAARELDPLTYAIAIGNKTALVDFGFCLTDEQLVAETREALVQAEDFGDAYGLSLARAAHGAALARSGGPYRAAGLELLELVRSGDMDIFGSVTEADLAAAKAPHERPREQIDILDAAIRSEIEAGAILYAGYPVAVLVGLLIERAAPGDLTRAEKLVAQLDRVLSGKPPALHLWPMSCRARLAAAAGGDATAYRQALAEYRDLADDLDAHGHIAIARRLATEPPLARSTP